MKQRRMHRRGMAGGTIAKWFISIVLIFGCAGVSYAAYSNFLTGSYFISTSGMSFIFDKKADIEAQMKTESGKVVDFKKCSADYSKKKALVVKGLGPIDLDDLVNDKAVITIKYAIKADEEYEDNGLQFAREVNEDDNTGYDLGVVELELLSETPVWKLMYNDMNFGTKQGSESGMIKSFLPKTLGNFHVYNQLSRQKQNDMMEGTLTLIQEGKPELPSEKIMLSELNLSDDVNSQIEGNSELVISGSYGFSIPLDLDQFNMEQ